MASLLGLHLTIGGCGGGGGGDGGNMAIAVRPADTTPAAFDFPNQSDVAVGTLIESAAITVTGIDQPAAIGVTGGEYNIDGGAYTANAGTVNNSQTVRVRHTSAPTPATTVSTTLTIGGVSATFASMTAAVESGDFTLVSPAVGDGGVLPSAYRCQNGDNRQPGISPPLQWSDAPQGTVGYAVIMDHYRDQDVVGTDTPSQYWLLWNIPSSVTGIPAGNPESTGTEGANKDAAGNPPTGYTSPCSPGSNPNTYTITVYALSADTGLGSVDSVAVDWTVLIQSIYPQWPSLSPTIALASDSISFTDIPDGTGNTRTLQERCDLMTDAFVLYGEKLDVDVTCDFATTQRASVHAWGMPDMSDEGIMDGILATNQQVPLPQPYRGSNAWTFPLNPNISDPDQSTATIDGPIAIAVDGVPIFDPTKQDGVGDTFLLGELGLCNGHAGRADDYHYHAAPVCIMQHFDAETDPLGFALDGFPIHGFTNPGETEDATASGLDDCNGEFDDAGNYHYHTTRAFPYVVGCMKGDLSASIADLQPRTRPPRGDPGTPVNPIAPSEFSILADAADPNGGVGIGTWFTFEYSSQGNNPVDYSIRYFVPDDYGDNCFDFELTVGGTVTGPTEYCYPNISGTTSGVAASPGGFLSSSVVLGRPTDSSISISVLVAETVDAYVEYRTASASYEPAPDRVVPRTIQANEPFVFELEGLVADTQYFYRLQYRDTNNPGFVASNEGRFHTHRPPGSTFGFAVQADPHLGSKRRSGPDPAERASEEPYAVTQAVTVASAADFVIDLGDTFMTEQNHGFGLYPSQNGIARANMEEAEVIDDYTFVRSLFSPAAHSTPLYLVPGNHEAESHRLHDGTEFNPAVWSNNARKRYFPTPTDGDFYSGSETMESFVDRHDGYYAWEWGNALFVVLDPFWYEGSGNDQWGRTLGFEQYSWLKTTLESSNATFKFLFLHHLVGGNDNEFGRARGGALFAEYYEWGGKTEGTEAFDFPTRRPGWGGLTIHDLLTANGVQIVFTGHDHTYIKELHPDGIIYQTVPQPSHSNTNQNQADRNALNYGYDVDNPSTVVLPSSGLLYVEISPTEARVEYRKIIDGCTVVTPGDCYQSADVYSVPAAR